MHNNEDGQFLEGISAILMSESPGEAFLNLVTRSDNDRNKNSWLQIIQQIKEHLKEFKDQFQRAFPRLSADHFRPLAAYYYLRLEEERKNSVWKRRKHKFFPRMTDVEAVKEFHNALYLSELAYSSTLEDVRVGLERFQKDSWALLYATVESKPHQPAHFFAIRKDESPLQSSKEKPRDRLHSGIVSILPWETTLSTPASTKTKPSDKVKFGARPNKQQYTLDESLEVALVIRGTKELGDVISDIMFETVDYRNGHRAHGGVVEAGKFLVQTHIDRLRQLLELSGKKVLRLWCIGHSLGGGAAAIAAIEFNDYDFIEASAVGFGTPSLLSAKLSESYQDSITTLVSDADIIPRLSAPAMVKLHYKVLCHHIGEYAKEDVMDFLDHLRAKMPNRIGLVDFLQEQFDKVGRVLDGNIDENVQQYKEDFEQYLQRHKETLERGGTIEEYLEPPGTCIHLFRDGAGYTASYTPCSFFTEIDFVPSMIDDHLIPPGYHRALVTLARDLMQDLDFRFEHQELPPT